MALQRSITDDLDALLSALPPHISAPLRHREDNANLLEIVMDLGRTPEARYPGSEADLSDTEVTHTDIEYVVSRIGEFGDDNRAGIERTLHRISCIRNRRGRIVGLTLRVGRAVFGTIRVIDDLVRSGKSILFLGRPGVGKTTMLREVARVLADEHNKRVIVVDTSNEIAGDGDIPHPGIGSARRMQVPTPTAQHGVMIEAVENHMPEVIIIDEIGTELEAAAARTIAERGVQLVATAHGNSLENLMMNPTLADLVGGIQSVTLSDEEARRRGTQKSILERKAPPTFDVIVEIQDWKRVAVHVDVAETVDAILRGYETTPETRELTDLGVVQTVAGTVTPIRRPTYDRPEPRGRRDRRVGRDSWGTEQPEVAWGAASEDVPGEAPPPENRVGRVRRIYPFGVSRNRLEQAIHGTSLPVVITNSLDETDTVLTLKSHYRRKPQTLREAESRGIPIYVLKSNTINQIQQALLGMYDSRPVDPVTEAMKETEDAIGEVLQGNQEAIELSPQNAYIRRLQHQIAQRYNLNSRSLGREPVRRVRITRDEGGPFPLGRE